MNLMVLAGSGVVIFPLLCFPLVFGVVIAIVVVGLKQQAKHWADVLDIAKRYQGRLNEGGFLEPKSIDFTTHGIPGRLTMRHGGKNSPPSTRVDLQLTLPSRLRISPQDFTLGLRKLFGAQDVEVGHPEFDAAFQIEAESEASARRMLTRELRGILMALRPDSVTMDARLGTVTVAVRKCLLPRPPEVGTFLDRINELVGILQGQAGERQGVKIVATTEAAGTCLTCGTALDGSAVRCAKCRSGQHRDCWNYSGGCATYACGGTKFTS